MQEGRIYIEKAHPQLSVASQCKLLEIHRSGLYYIPSGETELNLELMRKMDEHFLKYPFKGVPIMTQWLREDEHYPVNEKRIRRLMRLMGLLAIYPKMNLSKAEKAAYKFPYLLRNMFIERRNQAWGIDITYVPMKGGFMYLCAIIDHYSRYVVGWNISNTMTAEWVTEVIEEAITRNGKPEIINSDHGSQFTSEKYTGFIKSLEAVQISMDGKGRAIDNIFIERLWRSVKYENIYLHDYATGTELYEGLKEYFRFYNQQRHHQSLEYKTPESQYQKAAGKRKRFHLKKK